MSNFHIQTDGENILYAAISASQHGAEDKNFMNANFLLCKFFHIGLELEEDKFREVFKTMERADDYKVFLCNDGDVIFQWSDDTDTFDVAVDSFDFRQNIIDTIKKKYGNRISDILSDDEFFIDYSYMMNISDLKLECMRKMGGSSKSDKELLHYMENSLVIDTFKKTIGLIAMQRMMRANPHILIVEDQVFSQKMLTTILKNFTCHVAGKTGDALLAYMEKCPDIVLLDVDLPDISGHRLAGMLKKIDPNAYIIMVTANKYEDDVQRAKQNGVKGFIPKPYKKEKILDAIEKFKKARKA